MHAFYALYISHMNRVSTKACEVSRIKVNFLSLIAKEPGKKTYSLISWQSVKDLLSNWRT